MAQNQKALDQRGLKTLVLWVIWACICASVFIQLFQQADIWNYIIYDTSRVTWVILGTFVFGVFISFVHVAGLTWEWFYAYRLQYQLEKHGLYGATAKGRQVSSRFISSLQYIHKNGGQVDLSALSTVEFSGYIRGARFVALLGSLMITMGLIGTVLGLTITLTGLNGALENVGSDTMSVLIGLREAMSGMGLAFYTTLLGSIMGGVLLRMFAYIGDNSIEALQDLLTRTCMVYAAVDLTPSVQRDFRQLDRVVVGMETRLSALTQALQQSRVAMSDFSEEMQDLKAATRLKASDDEVFKAIAVHRHYAKVLRYELTLQKKLANFKQRLLASMGFSVGVAAQSRVENKPED
ncbi:MAG: MotA/TolQ/ExbB proton channel family protein [Mariprofundaceae bacterium]|nr:MotA/TolQ/ExbB proton channel family protein [Mariprofundaceae bacterium]